MCSNQFFNPKCVIKCHNMFFKQENKDDKEPILLKALQDKVAQYMRNSIPRKSSNGANVQRKSMDFEKINDFEDDLQIKKYIFFQFY